MFKYSKASVNILIDDFRKFSKIFRYVSMVFTVGFLIFKIAANSGILAINIFLLVAFVAFTILDYILEHKELKDTRKIFQRIYKWIKIGTQLITLTFSIIDIYNAPADANNAISIILTTLMILLWVVSFGSEILLELAIDRVEELFIAFKADVDDIKRPFTAVSNTFRKMAGKEIIVPETSDKKTKTLEKLNARIIADKIKDEDETEETE